MATVDHVGRGRLGINVVCGWNEDEFQMFGVSKHEHEDRYAQGEEWWGIIRRVWSGLGLPFDFDGTVLLPEGCTGLAAALPRADAADDERGKLAARAAVRHRVFGYAL
jgi:alkanesulfonate monooxygenase SsuD/methylene tetrahydromethanopterin reductase-like flavin-dependent oxidoreductase (luciferase family)